MLEAVERPVLPIFTSFVSFKIVKDTNTLPGSTVKFVTWYVEETTAIRNYKKIKSAERKLKLRNLCQQIKYAIRFEH